MCKRIIPVFLIIFLSYSSFADKDESKLWSVDFEKTIVIAKQKNGDLLLQFTGSDWCPPCKNLHKDVLTNSFFIQKITENFHLVKLDFPNDKSKQTEKEIAQNDRLKERYSITGFPTILLTDAYGRPYAWRVGYDGANAEEYVNYLLNSKTNRIERDKYLKKASTAKGIEKALLLDQALDSMDCMIVAVEYTDEIKEILSLDSDGSAGLKLKYEHLQRLPVLKSEIQSLEKEFLYTNAKILVHKLSDLFTNLERSAPEKALIYASRANAKLFTGEQQSAIEDMKLGIEIDPDSDTANGLRKFLNHVLKTIEETEK